MNDDKPTVDPRQRIGGIAEVARNIRLIWRLFSDRHVPLWTKAIPFLALAYVIWPIDIVPDALLGLGQLDDLTIILLGLKAFISLSPAAIVDQYRNKLRQDSGGAQDIVDTSYRVLDDEKREND